MPRHLIPALIAGAVAALAVAGASVARDEAKWPWFSMAAAFVVVGIAAFFLLGGRL
jgi:hypothetical protein